MHMVGRVNARTITNSTNHALDKGLSIILNVVFTLEAIVLLVLSIWATKLAGERKYSLAGNALHVILTMAYSHNC